MSETIAITRKKALLSQLCLRRPRTHSFFAASLHSPSLPYSTGAKPLVEGVSSVCTSQVLTTSQMLQGKNIRYLGESNGGRRLLSCTWLWALGLLFLPAFCDESCHLSWPITSLRSWHPLDDDSIWKTVLIGLCLYLLHTQTSLSHSRLLSKRKSCQNLI